MKDIPPNLLQALQSNTPSSFASLMEDESLCFHVDWREEDDAIVAYCENVLQTGRLSAEIIDIDAEPGFELYIQYAGKRAKVPLEIGTQDRHITLLALNQLLAREFELRYLAASDDSDTAALIALPFPIWEKIDRLFPATAATHFHKLVESPNRFR